MQSTSSRHAVIIPVEDQDDERVAPTESWLRQSARRFLRNRAAVACLVFMLAAGFVGVFAPLFTEYDPNAMDALSAHPLIDSLPSHAHWLGTDSLGRDILSRIIYGMRADIAIAVVGGVSCTVLGGLIGAVSGYRGGWIDEILVRITEFIFVIPGLLLIVLVLALFGNALDGPLGPYGRVILITAFIATDNWPIIMRLARGEALRMRDSQFVEAARVNGASDRAIVWRHLLPNMLGILLVQGALMVGGFMFVTAALSLFGLGVPPEWPDLGRMVIEGPDVAVLNPWEMIGPTVMLTALIVAPTFIGDGLRDAFDARSENGGWGS